MVKEYKYTVFYRAVLLVITIIGTYGVFEMTKPYGLGITFVIFAFILWFVLLVLRSKIVITEDYIVQDVGRLGKRIEYNWDKIDRVSRIPFSFLWMYKIRCKDKPSLMFPSMIANYVDLLEEIIKRSPNAIVDDSVIKFLEKAQNKKHQ